MRFSDKSSLHTYQPLYLKYRPQSLADLVGQSSVAQTLTNAIQHDRISHAYLFTGPRGTGKTSSARILAKSLNCEKGPTATPCLTCSSCIEVKNGNSPSVFEIDAASNNSVDDARAIIERAPLVAQGGRYKLYIIDECHMLTKEAFNALLKTIEEPPPMVIFILATTEEHKVPQTIHSRCQRSMFKLVGQKDLIAHLRKIAQLENINIEDEAIELVARRSGGGLRDALGLLDQASLLSTADRAVGVNDLLLLLGAVHEDALVQISAGIQQKEGYSVLTTVNSLLSEGREPAVLVVELAKHFLNLTKASYVNDTAGGVTAEALQSIVLGSQKYLQALVTQAKSFDRIELAQMVEYLDRLEQTCRRSSQPNLSLEMGVLALCHRHDITFIKDLHERLQIIENVLGDEIQRGPTRTSAAQANQRAASPNRQMTPPPVQQGGTSQPHSGYGAPAGWSPPQATPAQPLVSAAPASIPMLPQAIPVQTSQPSVSTAPPPVPILPPATPPVTTGAGGSASASAADQPTFAPSSHSSEVVPVAQAAGSDVSIPITSVQTNASGQSNEAALAPHSMANPVAAREEDGVMLATRVEEEVIPEVVSSVILHEEAEDSEDGDRPADSEYQHAQESIRSAPTNPSGSAPGGYFDLDEFWSDVKDALQKRHIPTFSVVSVHAFPISFEPENDTFVLGVRPELQKTLENKLEHVKAACAAVLNRTINVRVKVMTETGQPATASKRGPAAATGTQRKVNPSPSQPAPSRPKEPSQNSAPASAEDSSEDERRNSLPSLKNNAQPTPDTRPQPAQANKRDPQRKEDEEFDPFMINEAYKLFQGPGSRLIG